jgi:hypothetical protein
LETMDKESRWQLSKQPKSIEWHEFLKQLKDMVL